MTPLDRLDEWLASATVDAAWFARPNNFAWLTGGDNRVSTDAAVGVAAVGYDGDRRTVVTNNIEASRLEAEELPGEVSVETYDWHEQSLADAVADVSPTPAAADFDVPGFEPIDAASIRQPLSTVEIERYRTAGREAAEAVEAVVTKLEPQRTERETAGRLQQALTERGFVSPVVLVGGSERAQRYRHYTPKSDPLEDYALVSVTANRDGLNVSLTRTVAFDPPNWLAERTAAAMRVEATALAATQAVGIDGGTAGEVFEAIQTAYETVGFDGEWRHHHQGGAAGYAGREWKATPTSEAPLHLPMGYAWNPTVQGAKSEDAALVSADSVEVLSSTGEWPTRTVEAVGYDLTIERHDVLDLEA